MMKNKKYFQIDVNNNSRTADINIYGEITSWEWLESDVSSYSFIKQLDGLDVDKINVYINSVGGEVAEALAIYTALKRHKAKVNTFCDGFACSAASIIFCAGDVRTIGKIAMLMIHNCMSYVGYANSEKLRKAAADNDKINQSSIEAYKAVANISEDEIKELMNKETWLTAQESLDYGFATDIADDEEDDENSIVQSVQPLIYQTILNARNNNTNDILTIVNSIKTIVEDIRNNQQQVSNGNNGLPSGRENAFKNFFNNI